MLLLSGSRSLLAIAEICNASIWGIYPIVKKSSDHQLLCLFVESINA